MARKKRRGNPENIVRVQIGKVSFVSDQTGFEVSVTVTPIQLDLRIGTNEALYTDEVYSFTRLNYTVPLKAALLEGEVQTVKNDSGIQSLKLEQKDNGVEIAVTDGQSISSAVMSKSEVERLIEFLDTAP